MYAALLPGITNVTDRAWHFGFYPWFVRAFEQRNPEASDAEFRKALRRADCLATLVASRHAIVRGDDGQDDRLHGAAFPGRLKLVPAARSLPEAGSFSALRLCQLLGKQPAPIFQERSRWSRPILPRRPARGVSRACRRPAKWRPLHDRIRPTASRGIFRRIRRKAFMNAVDGGDVTAGLLDSLAAFCPCALQDQREIAREHLVDMVLARVSPWATTGQSRRLTLGLALDLLEAADGAR